MEESLYTRLPGERYLPTTLTQGPWAADRQHGGPVAALLAHALDEAAPDGWLTAQLTIDFLAAVPLAEIAVSTEIVKRGRRTSCVSAALSSGDRLCAAARAWQVAPGRVAGPRQGGAPAGQTAGSAAPPPLPENSSYGRASFQFGYQQAVEMRFVRGSFRERAPATAWARLLVPVLPGAPPSALQRVAALADFGSGISAILDRRFWSYHNLDLSVHLHRYPLGEWICLDSASVIGPDGSGLCQTGLHDASGPCGTAAQSLFVSAVGAPPEGGGRVQVTPT